jgi:cell division protein FtsB
MKYTTSKRHSIGAIVYFVVMCAVGFYFTFAAVQGDYGIFSRAEIEIDAATLQVELDTLLANVTELQNKTRRLSDTYLDLDLLDEQARDMLGYVRSDEIVIR